MLLFYVRHGNPCYHPDSLTPLGERQAESVAKRLALFGVDKVFSSTSTRALETARPTCELLGRKLNEVEAFHEKNAEQYFKIPTENESGKIEMLWPWTHSAYRRVLLSREARELGYRWYEHPELSRFREGYEKLGREADEWLASLGYHHDRETGTYRVTAKNPNERIALFAHEGIGKIFLSNILDIPFPIYSTHFEMNHSGITVIEFLTWKSGETTARVLSLSNDSHLYRDGLPLNYKGGKVRF